MGRLSQGSASGFSLLEMVVVMAVLATLSIGAALTLGRRAEPQDARRFAAACNGLMEIAVLGQEARGLRVMPGGWQVLVPAGPFEGWQPAGAVQRFRGEALFEGTEGAILPRPDADPPLPDLVFLPDGKVTPVTITFTEGGAVTACRSVPLSGLDCGA